MSRESFGLNVPLADYLEKRKNEWFERRFSLWESKKRDIEHQIMETENESRREVIRTALMEHVAEKPTEVRMEQVNEICDVESEKTESEQSWPERHEVEQRAIEVATEHYEGLGYEIHDIARQTRGYDTFCGKRAEVLRVEVKGILGAFHPALTEKERRTAAQFEEGFELFILDISENRERKHAIPDPVANVTLTPHEKTVYSVTGYGAFEKD